jgi:hypothetical protein
MGPSHKVAAHSRGPTQGDPPTRGWSLCRDPLLKGSPTQGSPCSKGPHSRGSLSRGLHSRGPALNALKPFCLEDLLSESAFARGPSFMGTPLFVWPPFWWGPPFCGSPPFCGAPMPQPVMFYRLAETEAACCCC